MNFKRNKLNVLLRPLEREHFYNTKARLMSVSKPRISKSCVKEKKNAKRWWQARERPRASVCLA